MNEVFVTRDDIEHFSIIASESHDIARAALARTEYLQEKQDMLDSRSYQVVCLQDEFARLADLVELMYSILGVNIRNADGGLREVDEVAHDLRSFNPKIILSFEELMQF